MAFKNNNPGNIRFTTSIPGIIGKSSSGFAIFSSEISGVYGMIFLLSRYVNNGTNTIRKIISKYAPPKENDTEKYIAYVSKASGIPPNQILKPGEVSKLIPSMVKMETGKTLSATSLFFAKNKSFTTILAISGIALLFAEYNRQK